MKAIQYEQFEGPVTYTELPDPVPPNDGVVVRVGATGLCRSDWHGWKGHDSDIHLPHVPGHEFAGVVAAVGDATRNFSVGDRVTVPFSMGCGQCVNCRVGHLQVCDRYVQPGFTIWGSFAEYVALPHADVNLVHLPDGIEFSVAASLGCRYGTAYHALVMQADLRPGQWVAVHGCGGLGLAVIQLCRAFDARVVALDVRSKSLERAVAEGAEAIVEVDQTSADDVGARVREITAGGADVSVDAVGGEAACRQSIASLRKRGVHVQVGLFGVAERQPRIPMARVVAEELKLVGSHGIAATEYRRLLELVTDGRVDPARLVTAQRPMRDAVERLPQMDEDAVTVFIP